MIDVSEFDLNRIAAAAEDITLPSGTLVPKGTFIHTPIAAAKRDPGVFVDPKRLVLSRLRSGLPPH